MRLFQISAADDGHDDPAGFGHPDAPLRPDNTLRKTPDHQDPQDRHLGKTHPGGGRRHLERGGRQPRDFGDPFTYRRREDGELPHPRPGEMVRPTKSVPVLGRGAVRPQQVRQREGLREQPPVVLRSRDECSRAQPVEFPDFVKEWVGDDPWLFGEGEGGGRFDCLGGNAELNGEANQRTKLQVDPEGVGEVPKFCNLTDLVLGARYKSSPVQTGERLVDVRRVGGFETLRQDGSDLLLHHLLEAQHDGVEGHSPHLAPLVTFHVVLEDLPRVEPVHRPRTHPPRPSRPLRGGGRRDPRPAQHLPV
mmetsp:Transcript_12784/g.19586  ORF Transcript_12784/g.19586 Transcript_12784/m.19586 type:complete len:306 (-) Transcript_12784:166-1083(-)